MLNSLPGWDQSWSLGLWCPGQCRWACTGCCQARSSHMLHAHSWWSLHGTAERKCIVAHLKKYSEKKRLSKTVVLAHLWPRNSFLFNLRLLALAHLQVLLSLVWHKSQTGQSEDKGAFDNSHGRKHESYCQHLLVKFLLPPPWLMIKVTKQNEREPFNWNIVQIKSNSILPLRQT